MAGAVQLVELDAGQVDRRTPELITLLTEALTASTLGAFRPVAREVASTMVFAASPRAVVVIAETATGPAGLLVAHHEPDENCVFINWVAVGCGRRRIGIATRLVDHLEQIHPTATIYGSVDQDDPAAVAFWQQRGWAALRPPPRRILMGRSPQAA